MSFHMGTSATRRVGGVPEVERLWIPCGTSGQVGPKNLDCEGNENDV
ncbi:hypothetical protein [Clostridium kluyveri]|nr:hypothetical protein [Clostridium kluyveri]